MSDKVRVCPIRVNVLLTLDRINLDLLLSTVATTALSRWMVGVAAGAYGWLRGAYVGGGAHTAAEGAHTPIGEAHTAS
jgi:hypothetical protein